MATLKKIIGSVWFGTIGIILKEGEGDTELRSYIGASDATFKEVCMLEIATLGKPFPVDEAKTIISKHGSLNEKYEGTIVLEPEFYCIANWHKQLDFSETKEAVLCMVTKDTNDKFCVHTDTEVPRDQMARHFGTITDLLLKKNTKQLEYKQEKISGVPGESRGTDKT